ncbi:O-antigen ligase family protein [Arcobacter sp. YIC-310]|uniref:O-antigen ligase family protein n=1 Tax=Arcobacter sp. YIC-310 TaxID=3376632 RepID=UPI003C268D9F
MLLQISIALYIFLLFNREFVPFIDLRFLILPIFAYLLIFKFINILFTRNIVIYGTKKNIIYYMLFIFIVFLSNSKWYFNPYSPNEDILINVILLYIYNFLAVTIFALYWKKINLKVIGIVVFVSGLILFLSMILQYIGVQELPFARNVRELEEFELSIIGTRIGGYAEDPNYATFSMMLWFVITFILFKNRFLVLFVFLLSFVGVILSFSKTIILASFIILSFFIAKKLKLLIPYTILFISLIAFSAYYIYEIFMTLSTMSTRFKMWEIAFYSFLNNPILGSGVTSVRSNFLFSGNWYVQPHNSFIAILADSGLFAFILFLCFFIKAFSLENKIYIFLVWLLFIFSFSQELFIFQYPYFVLGVLPIIVLLKQNRIYTTKIRI